LFVQSWHVWPCCPHALVVVPGWHVPDESQQPLQELPHGFDPPLLADPLLAAEPLDEEPDELDPPDDEEPEDDDPPSSPVVESSPESSPLVEPPLLDEGPPPLEELAPEDVLPDASSPALPELPPSAPPELAAAPLEDVPVRPSVIGGLVSPAAHAAASAAPSAISEARPP
jgi:hypothetical protein